MHCLYVSNASHCIEKLKNYDAAIKSLTSSTTWTSEAFLTRGTVCFTSTPRPNLQLALGLPSPALLGSWVTLAIKNGLSITCGIDIKRTYRKDSVLSCVPKHTFTSGRYIPHIHTYTAHTHTFRYVYINFMPTKDQFKRVMYTPVTKAVSYTTFRDQIVPIMECLAAKLMEGGEIDWSRRLLTTNHHELFPHYVTTIVDCFPLQVQEPEDKEMFRLLNQGKRTHRTKKKFDISYSY